MKKVTFLLAALICSAWCATAQTTENGYEYVDLGLPSGLKWATCNVGATSPEEYGNYYAWGETATQETYDWSTYKWCNGNYNTQTKYCTNSSYGTVDDKTVLEPEDDAAAVNWGGAWRMPTDEEWTELRENCTWTWTNGVNGYEVKGTNGNYIFLPAAGFRNLGDLEEAGYEGNYRSTSLDTDYPYSAWGVYFYSGSVSRDGNSRYLGFPVRPVLTTYSITLAAENGTVTGAGTYPQGTAVTLTATAAEGYYFVQWSDGTTNKDYTFTLTQDTTLTAEFAANPVYNTVGGVFSVAADKQVQFSAGNLQYTQSADVWSFAAHQYDMLGTANINGSELANTIDLFGWSGSTATAQWGISTSTGESNYSGDFADWGQNVGDGTTWRTLTSDEWNYLRSSRANAASLMGVARINLDEVGTTYANGLILLPDTWTCPDGITFTTAMGSYDNNTFTLEQWQKLESAGAVFLPASGRRSGSSIYNVQYNDYWSATNDDPIDAPMDACYLYFDSSVASWSCNGRDNGRAVRLVQDYVPYTVTATCDAEQGSVSGGGTYAKGTAVTLTATAAEGYYFVQWSDGTTNKDYTFTLTQDTTLTAEFAAHPVYNAVGGVFSVAADKQVQFSAGNLQYTQSADVWSFAAHQYDTIGAANVNGSTLGNKINLFGWSGSTATAKWGISTSQNNEDYSGDFADWGQNIGDGTTWRTLTNDEWTYLRSTRANAASLMGVARINLDAEGITYTNGLILLPDSWTCPEDVTFKSGFSSEYSIQSYADHQTFTLEQWEKLEAAGAVFLPTSGNREGSSINDVRGSGRYWSATLYDSDYADCLHFYSDEADWYSIDRYKGRAVRLVQDYVTYTVTATCDAEQGNVSGGGTYPQGTEVTLTATAAEGYHFVQWSDGNTDNPRTITVTADVTLAAEFASNTTTGLAAVTASPVYAVDGRIVCEGEFRIYDLLGRDVTRLNGSLCGVYVVKTADSAVKVVVR